MFYCTQLSTFLLPIVAVAALATEGFASATLQLAALLGIGATVAIAGAAVVLMTLVTDLIAGLPVSSYNGFVAKLVHAGVAAAALPGNATTAAASEMVSAQR